MSNSKMKKIKLSKVSGGETNIHGDVNATGNLTALDNSNSETVDERKYKNREDIIALKFKTTVGLGLLD